MTNKDHQSHDQKTQIDARHAQIGVIGDNAQVDIHQYHSHQAILSTPLSRLFARFGLEQWLVSLNPQQQRRNELAVLRKVRKFWIESVLEQALEGTLALEPGKSIDDAAIDNPHPWNTLLETPEKPLQQLIDNSRIIDVYEALGKETNPTLLILGEPGSGKTITLLTLARAAIERAEQNPNYHLPIVFHLSSWAERQLPLEKWLIGELNAKYLIPKKVAQQWIGTQRLLLLLDGLDEVDTKSQENCIEAINTSIAANCGA